MKWSAGVLLFVCLFACRATLIAQPAAPDEPGSDYTESMAIGITILSSPSLRFSSASDYRNGVSIEHNTLQLSVSLGLSWSLQVRATDDLRYLTQSIPVSAIGVQAIGLGNRPEVFLKTTNQLLVSGLATSLLNTALLIRYRALNGSDFLKPAGTYTTTLVFTYTAL